MKPRQRPRYVNKKWLSGARQWAYYFEVPSWARAKGCTVENCALGTDRDAAYDLAETVHLPQFDSWRTAGLSDMTPARAIEGTFDWLIKTYREAKRYLDLDPGTKKLHENGFGLVANHSLKDGRRFGSLRLESITPRVADRLLETISSVKEEDEDGNEVIRSRQTTANHAMKSCRRAWNVAYRAEPDAVPKENPFAKMGLADVSKETPAATYQELLDFVAACDANDRSSIGTAALMTWEWLQRERHIFMSFVVDHYRPKSNPDAVLVVHPKTGKQVWWPLFDPEQRERVPLFPTLMARLDKIRSGRIGGLMLVRDWKDKGKGVPLPWASEQGDLSYLSHQAKAIITKAGLRPELTFASFRHGGLTEAGDSDMTDREIVAQSAHSSPKVLNRYVKKTMRQVASGAKKRAATRTKVADPSE